jgi:protease-4
VAIRRGVAFVLVFIGLAALISVAGLMFLYLAMGSGPTVPGRAALVLRPGGAIQEMLPDDVLGQVLGDDAATVRTIVQTLQMAKRDDRITTLLLVPTSLQLPFWGKVQELRDAILDFKQSGKKVVAFLEYGGDREYYLASAADQIFLLPTSPLDLTGVASYEVFLRGALDKIGATPDFVHVGEYKTAVNQFTERGFTPEHREMSESLNRDMYDQLVRGIAQARGKSEEEVRRLIDEGPFTPQAALQAGLVDDLAYLDQVDDRVPELSSDGAPLRRIEGSAYARISPRSVGIRPNSRVAVIYAVGTIVSGRSGNGLNGATVGSDTLVEQIRRVRDDDSIRAIVLRVDSPGGSSVASDVIWRELMITRDQNPNRPLIASMSDLAASGGYYISMPAQTIVAQPATLTGSIGIFGGKFVIDGTLEKLGVTTATIASGRNATTTSPFETFTPEQRAKLQAYMDGFYQTFITKVAESRNTTPERIDQVARGRVWTGLQAKDRGLVDELGGLDRAIEIAKERAGIPAGEDVELVIYPARRSLYEALSEELGNGGVGFASLAQPARALASVVAPALLFRRGEALALMPFALLR